MGKLFEGFKILCTDFDFISEKGGNYSRGDIIQGRILIKVIQYAIFMLEKKSAMRKKS